MPKGRRVTVTAPHGAKQGDATRDYLREFVERRGPSRASTTVAVRDSGHLTRCRSDDSPLRKGRVIVAGDAAGLLDPWTREGISFALRSGALAGELAAKAAACAIPDSPSKRRSASTPPPLTGRLRRR